MPKILFLVSEDWYFCSHRMPVARAARDAGFEVVVATRVQEHAEPIRKEGFKLIPIRLRRRNRNPLREVLSVIEIFLIYKAERPDIVHHVSIQPVLYGTLAARMARIPAIINALAGMGYAFSSEVTRAKLLQNVIKAALKLLLNSENGKVIVQNSADLRMLAQEGIVKRERLVLIKGSGVDVKQFLPKREDGGLPIIILASRMLWDKGIKEFVEAAGYLKNTGIKARFVLAGNSDLDNPTAIPIFQLEKWHTSGIVEWWGYCNNMVGVFEQSNIICLPSAYGEGVPKVLIEAASCGRPIVTSDMPGCREIVRHNENGLLVPPRDPRSLANALKVLIENPELRAKMGARGREIVEAEFSEEIVVKQTMEIYKRINPQITQIAQKE